MTHLQTTIRQQVRESIEDTIRQHLGAATQSALTKQIENNPRIQELMSRLIEAELTAALSELAGGQP